MTKNKIYNPPLSVLENSNIKESEFEELYQWSLNEPEEFWASQAENYLSWNNKWSKVKELSLIHI